MNVRRILACILCLAMCMGCVGSLGYAEGAELDTKQYRFIQETIDHQDKTPTDAASITADGTYFIQEDENIFWRGYPLSSTKAKAFYYYDTLSADGAYMGNSGKYVIQYKMRTPYFGGNDGTNRYSITTDVNYTGEKLGGAFMGFKLVPSKSGTNMVAAVQFAVRYKTGTTWSETSYSVTEDTLTYKTGEWYTYSHIYDLDAKEATLIVYDSSGAEVFNVEGYKFPSDLDLTYDNFNFCYIRTDTKYGSGIDIDDFAIAEVLTIQGAPKVTDITIDGVPQEGETLTASAVVEGEPGAVTSASYQWQYQSASGWKNIEGATESTYVVTGDVCGCKLRVVVTPLSDTEPKTGEPVASNATEEAIGYNQYIQETIDNQSETPTDVSSITADGAYYVKDNDNIFYRAYAASGTKSKSLYYGDDEVSAAGAAMGSSGQYVIQYRQKTPSVGGSNGASRYSAYTYVNYKGARLGNPFMGFQVIPAKNEGNLTASFKFLFRYLPEGQTDTKNNYVEKTYDIPGTWTYTPDAWYTYRHIYDLDAKSATMIIYDAAGKEQAKAVFDFPTEFNTVYGDFNFCYIRTNVSYGTYVDIDDFSITKTVSKPVTVDFDSDKVSVTYGGAEIKAGKTVLVPYNSLTPATFRITAKDGYEINKVLVNEKEQPDSDSVELISVKEAVTLKVLTEEPPVVESLHIEGAAQVGGTLKAVAVISDVNGDDTSAVYQWQYLDGNEWKDITGAAGQTYSISDSMLGKKLRVVATPVSNRAPKQGSPFESDETTEISQPTNPPSATSLSVTGEYLSGNVLTVSYTYVKSDSDVEEGNSSIIFETSDEENGTYTSVQTSSEKKYKITNEDMGKWMRIRVIPKDLHGVSGEELKSTPVRISSKVSFFVSTTGSDNNEGTVDAPFATVEKARDTIRAMDSLPAGGVVVNIMGGTYPLTQAIRFTAEDSGTKESPIVYQAYNDEEVVFVGGKDLDTSKLQKVTDSEILDSLIDPEAREHLMMIDLKEQGITMHDLVPFGRGYSGYAPNQVYMNDTLLTEARWPNDDQSQNLVICEPLLNGVDTNVYNGANMPVKLVYPDAENRSEKWNIKKGDAYIGGAVVVFWGQVNLRIDNVDTENKVVTTMDKSTYSLIPGAVWGQQYKIYFSNILAEIDQPGESYVDREKGILYLYPVGDTQNAKMTVSQLGDTMIMMEDTSNVTLKGLDFKTSRGSLVYAKRTDSITIEDGEFAGAMTAISLNEDCTNTIIRGNHLYNLNSNAISISGTEKKRMALESTDTLIENNNFHTYSLMKTGLNGVYISNTVGTTIRHNEFNDFPQAAVLISQSNDTIIEYNKIMNGVQCATDYGSIYWGRDNTTMGNIVRYNYFENIGNKQICQTLKGGHAVSVFTDDAATSGDIYGNVFYDAGIERGMLATNGGEFLNIHGNIFIADDTSRNEYVTYLNTWGNNNYTYKDNGKTVALKKYIPARAWLYLMDMRAPVVDRWGSNSNLWNDSRKSMMFSEKWINHYKGTMWEKSMEFYSEEHYNAAKAFYDANDADGLLKYMNENLANEANTHQYGNVALGLTEFFIGQFEVNDIHDNYTGSGNGVTDAEKAMFVDYEGKNFTLTDAALNQIRKSVPEFQEIPFDEIGLLSDVGGHKPVAEIESGNVVGIPAIGNEITASYTYQDADGDDEGTTKVYWYISNTADGNYTMIPWAQGKSFVPSVEHAGRYLKYQVIPYDTKSLRGAAVMSAPIAVKKSDSLDWSALSEAIKKANGLIANAVVGTDEGEYPQSAVDTFVSEVKAAEAVAADANATQYQINIAAELLESQILVFVGRQNSPFSQFDITFDRMAVNKLLEDTENWTRVERSDYNVGGTVKFEDGSLIIEGTDTLSAWATYAGEKFRNTEFSFMYKAEMTAEDPSAWGGIYLRQSSTDNILWKDGNSGSMIDMKQDKLMLQEYPAIGTYKTLDTFQLEMGREYLMTAGIYDTNSEDKVVLIFTVDGETVFAEVLESDKLLTKEGYLGFNAGKNTKVTISPVYADKTELKKKIEAAESFLMSSTTGTGYNQYPENLKSALESALSAAKAVDADEDAVTYDVKQAVSELGIALANATQALSMSETISANGSLELNYSLPAADLVLSDAVTDFTIVVDSQNQSPEIKVDAKDVYVEIADGTVLSGSFKLPLAGDTPSATFGLGDVSRVYGSGASYVTASKPVKVVLEGQKGMSVAYKNANGKYTQVKTAISEAKALELIDKGTVAVAVKSGNDIIVYTSAVTEFITYTKADEEEVSAPSGGGGGSVSVDRRPQSGGSGLLLDDDTSTIGKNETKDFVFDDVVSHWAKSDIMAMYNAGVVSGVTKTTYNPDRAITRAEFAALIARAIGLKSVASEFSDVTTDDWFNGYVGSCAKAGIVTGFEGKFRPNDTITRQEMAAMIVRAYEYSGKTATEGTLSFTDADKISDWAKPYVAKAVGTGIITGMPDGSFAPMNNATRAQAAVMLSRMVK